MIRRLYVHNYRCLENFDLVLREPSILLIGKNGSGKTTVGRALYVLQRIARGTNRVRALVKPEDLTRGHTDVPVRFEIEAEISGETYLYGIAFELPEGFKELRVADEKLTVDGRPIYTRELAQVSLARTRQEQEARFGIDWHLVALPIVQEQSHADPLSVFKRWLSRLLILWPMPSLIDGNSEEETPTPKPDVTDFGAWLSGLLIFAPAAYAKMDEFLKQVMPDLRDIQNRPVGKDARSIAVQFSNDLGNLSVPFKMLSDGEKCFMIGALAIAANYAYGPLVSFWDEPDNYLALDEVGQFVLALRRAFQSGGQFIATSHNPEAVSAFSRENTFHLHRNSHLEPPTVRRLQDLQVDGDLVSALIRGDVEP
ncbi:MAG: AAA family ATPase [Bryobacteraceae bacterium]